MARPKKNGKQKPIRVYVDERIMKRIEKARGMMPRSIWIKKIIKEKLDETRKIQKSN